jgi:EPS-associated MarR family transcriptional regulator
LADNRIRFSSADPFFEIQRSWFEHDMKEIHFKLLRLIESRPQLTQRELARELGVSLGKVNYCVNVLIEQGWIKARIFCNSRNKLAYAYLLTPKGIEQKTVVAVHFLRRKVVEYKVLRKEIAQLRRDVHASLEHRPQ